MSEYRDEAIDVLDRAGVPYRTFRGGKHEQLEFTGPDGIRHKRPADVTSGDQRASLNNVKAIECILKASGAQLTTPNEPKLFWSGCDLRTSSLDIAKNFGKQHKDVLRAYDDVVANLKAAGCLDFTERNFALSEYVDPTGRKLRCIDMTRDGFVMLVMGFTGMKATQWRVSYIKAFNSMSDQAENVMALTERVDVVERDLKAATDLVLEIQCQPQALAAAPVPAPKPKRRRSYRALASRYRASLIDLIDAIDNTSSFTELEAGACGNGPVMRACKVAKLKTPPNLSEWLADGDS